MELVSPAGDRTPLVITITAVRKMFVADIGLHEAQACGHRTSELLREEWRSLHPRLDLANVLYVELGDQRDLPLFLTSTRAMREGGIGDYTHNRGQASDDLEVLRPDEVNRLVHWNRQKQQAKQAKTSRKLQQRSLAERAAAIEKAGQAVRDKVMPEMRVVEQRVARAERKLLTP